MTDRDLFNQSQIEEFIRSSNIGLGDDENAWSWQGMKNVMTLYYKISKIRLPSIPVEKVMVKDPTTVFSKTTISAAAKVMADNDFGQLPVTDADDKLIGMLYELDVIASITEE